MTKTRNKLRLCVKVEPLYLPAAATRDSTMVADADQIQNIFAGLHARARR